jgi:hypothetical protein
MRFSSKRHRIDIVLTSHFSLDLDPPLTDDDLLQISTSPIKTLPPSQGDSLDPGELGRGKRRGREGGGEGGRGRENAVPVKLSLSVHQAVRLKHWRRTESHLSVIVNLGQRAARRGGVRGEIMSTRRIAGRRGGPSGSAAIKQRAALRS